MIGEVVFLHGIAVNYQSSLELFDLHSKDYFDDREHLRKVCADSAIRFLDMTRARYGDPEFLVLKYPQLTPLFPYLHQLLPDAKFLVSLRDPCDAVASAVVAQRKGAREFADAKPAEIADFLTKSYLRCLLCTDQSFAARTAYAKYEHLVSDPASVIEKLHRFTEIDFSGVDPHQSAAQSGWAPDMDLMRNQPTLSELHGKAISSTRIGRYVEVLSEAEAKDVEAIGKQLLDFYELDHSVFGVAATLIDENPPNYEITLSEIET